MKCEIFGLIVIVKPKETLRGLFRLSFSLERDRFLTEKWCFETISTHVSEKQNRDLLQASGGGNGFTEDIYGLWLRLDLKEMFLEMSQSDF